MSVPKPITNPCERAQQQPATSKPAMGPQSQRQLTVDKRTHKMQQQQGPMKKLKDGNQSTLTGERTFDPLKDCQKCKAKLGGRDLHRCHHPLCWNNRRTHGVTTKVTLESVAESERLRKHFSKPEVFSSRNIAKEAAATFFVPQKLTATTTTTSTITTPSPTTTIAASEVDDLCDAASSKAKDEAFCKECEKCRAPLAMVAFAGLVVERIVHFLKLP